MAEYLMRNRITAAGLRIIVVSLGLMMGALSAVSAVAGDFIDPTRSPTDIAQGMDGAVDAAPVLQSVMMSSGRKMAVISGQTVKIGEKVGEAKLLRLNDHEAVLRNPDGTTQTLQMHPAVEKKIIAQPQEVPAGVRREKRPVKKTGHMR